MTKLKPNFGVKPSAAPLRVTPPRWQASSAPAAPAPARALAPAHRLPHAPPLLNTSTAAIHTVQFTMLAKAVVLAALVAVVSASIPITSPISLAQRLTAIQGSISHSDCVPCEEAMGHAIHTAAEAGQSAKCASHALLFSLGTMRCMLCLNLSQVGWENGWIKSARISTRSTDGAGSCATLPLTSS